MAGAGVEITEDGCKLDVSLNGGRFQAAADVPALQAPSKGLRGPCLLVEGLQPSAGTGSNVHQRAHPGGYWGELGRAQGPGQEAWSPGQGSSLRTSTEVLSEVLDIEARSMYQAMGRGGA